jgi:hypothetical protein
MVMLCICFTRYSCLDLLRRSCSASVKLLKPVRGDSVFRRFLAGGGVHVVWDVMSS